MHPLRRIIRNQLLKWGWDVRRTASLQQDKKARYESELREKWQTIQRYSPKTVLDIGANVGQFARLCRSLLPEANIISFEPLQDCFNELSSMERELAPVQFVQSALGNEEGTVTIHRNAQSPSSSILEMEDLHIEEFPSTADCFPEDIQIQRLDGISPELDIELPLLIKVDVQGFERNVLLGGEQTVKQAIAIILEISAYPLYRGEANFEEILDILRSWGFAYRGNIDQWVSQRDSRILQFDALFENQNLVNELE